MDGFTKRTWYWFFFAVCPLLGSLLSATWWPFSPFFPWCFLLLTTVVSYSCDCSLLNLCSGGSKQRQSGKGRFGRSQLKAGGFTFSPFSESESEFLLEYCSDNWQKVGFLPGHFDRALPGLLRIRKLPESPVVAEIQADYEEELDVLKATGHTRDAWCYIIVYNTAGKFMVDIVVVIISRFLVGAGYLDSVHQNALRTSLGWLDPSIRRTRDRPKGDLLHLRGDVTCSSFYDQIGVLLTCLRLFLCQKDVIFVLGPIGTIWLSYIHWCSETVSWREVRCFIRQCT